MIFSSAPSAVQRTLKFSSAVYSGKTDGVSMIAPTRLRAAAAPRESSLFPNSVYPPPLLPASPHTMRMSVVFPAPLRPTNP